MSLALTEMERDIVEAVRRFANGSRLRSAADTERIFSSFVDFDEFRARPSGLRNEVTSNAAESYIEVRATVRDWLTRIANADSKARRRRVAVEVGNEVAPIIATGVTTGPLVRNGRLEQVTEFGSVGAVCAYGVALIVDDRRGLTTRLLQCAWCENFNLALNPKGRPNRFCPGHKAKYDASTGSERVKKSRQKAKARKP